MNVNDWRVVVAGALGSNMAIRDDGTLWGDFGASPIGSSGRWRTVTTGVEDAHYPAIRDDGSLWGWGENWAGQLGKSLVIYELNDVPGGASWGPAF